MMVLVPVSIICLFILFYFAWVVYKKTKCHEYIILFMIIFLIIYIVIILIIDINILMKNDYNDNYIWRIIIKSFYIENIYP